MDRISQIEGRINQIESLFEGPQKQTQTEGSASFKQMLEQAQNSTRIDMSGPPPMMAPFMVPGMPMAPGISPMGPQRANPTGFINPIPGGKLSPYKGDDGLDIHCPRGTQVMAAKDGVVVYNDPGGHSAWEGPGNDTGAIRIKHADGTETWYAHLSGRNENLKPGMPVKAGQVIGQTGTANNVPHLHMSIFYSSGGDNGGFMDPFDMAKMMEQQQQTGAYAYNGMPGMQNPYMPGMQNPYGMPGSVMQNPYGMPSAYGMQQGNYQIGNPSNNMNNILNMQLNQAASFMGSEDQT